MLKIKELKKTFLKSNFSQIVTFSGSTSFFSALSLAPVVILLLELTSFFSLSDFSSFFIFIQKLFGNDLYSITFYLFENAKKYSSQLENWRWFTILIMLINASFTIDEIQKGLDATLQIKLSKKKIPFNLFTYIKNRAMHIIFLGGLLLISIFSIATTEVLSRIQNDFKYFSFLTDFSFITFNTLALWFLFRFIPSIDMGLKYSLFLGFLTSIVHWILNKSLLKIVLSFSSFSNFFGILGSLLSTFTWIYFSIFTIYLVSTIFNSFIKKTNTN